MKVAIRALLVTVVGLSLMGGAANAAQVTKKKATKKQTTAKLPAKVEAAPGYVAPAPIAAAETTSTANIRQTVTETAPKRWGMLIDIWAEGQVRGMNLSSDENGPQGDEGKEVMSNSIQLRPSYKITDTSSVAVGWDIEHTFGSVKGEGSGTFTSHDVFVMVSSSKLALMGPVALKGYLRPYLPTSEKSQDPEQGRYAAIRAGLTAAAPIGGGLELSYNLEPRYFFAKNKSYRSLDDKKQPKWTGTEDYRLKHWLGLSFEDGKLSGYQNLGLRHQIYNQDYDATSGQTLAQPQKDQLYVETGVGYKVMDNLGLVAGVYTETNNYRNNDGWQFFDDNEYLYFLEGVVTF